MTTTEKYMIEAKKAGYPIPNSRKDKGTPREPWVLLGYGRWEKGKLPSERKGTHYDNLQKALPTLVRYPKTDWEKWDLALITLSILRADFGIDLTEEFHNKYPEPEVKP